MTDIVTRLREGVFGTDETKTDAVIHSRMQAAADEIERLRGERDMWRQENLKKQIACEQMGARIVALEAERKAARREALEQAMQAAMDYSHRACTPQMGIAAAIRALLEGDK